MGEPPSQRMRRSSAPQGGLTGGSRFGARRWPLRLAGAAGVSVAAGLSIAAGVPTWYSPYALPTVLPLLYADSLLDLLQPEVLRRLLEALPLGLAFLLWTSFVGRDRSRIPWLSHALALLTAGLSAAMVVPAWTNALRHWGPAFTLTATAGNLAAITTLAVLALRNRRAPAHTRAFAFHLVLFVWIAWCAVPWFAGPI